MNTIAATATIEKSAILGKNISIGPGCYIGPQVTLGDNCVLHTNVAIIGRTTLGCRNTLHANVVLGDGPQMLGHDDVDTRLVIGDDNNFRENVTVNRGSLVGSGVTQIGDHNFFMIGSHVGHDVVIEDHIVIGNYFQIAGHCKIERRAWLSGMGGLHQFVTIGRFAYLAGLSAATHDIPPFMRCSGNYPCEVRGLNLVGLQRNGFSQASIQALLKAYKQLYRDKEHAISIAVEAMEKEGITDEHVRYLIDFVKRSMSDRVGRSREELRH